MIKYLITDVDGVLTDGGFYYTPEGKVMKKFGPHDADGVKMLKDMDIIVHAVTADKRGFEISKTRCDDMNIPLTLVKGNRLQYIEDNYDVDEVAFVGDGYFDAASLAGCKYGFAPANATDYAKEYASHVLKSKGGEGVLLEVALLINDLFR